MSKWKCNNCETINDSGCHICEVCEACAPYISKFECDSSDISNPLMCSWEAENISRLFVQLNDELPIEVIDNKYFFYSKRNCIIRLIAENEITRITYEYPILISKPRIDYFEVNKINVYVDEKVEVKWKVSNAETIYLNDIKVLKEGSLILEASILDIEIKALNSSGNAQKRISLKRFSIPKINFSSDKKKIKSSDNIGVLLNWSVTYEKWVILKYNGKEEICKHRGKQRVYPKETTSYSLDVIGLDGERHFLKQINIEVLPEATIKFEVDKEYVFPNIPFTLKWETENAKKVTLNGKDVDLIGGEVFEDGIQKETKYTLSVTDEFGTKEKEIVVKMLPLPRIESLVVPMPNIEKSINMTVNLNIPNIAIDLLSCDLQKVGLNVEAKVVEGINAPPKVELKSDLEELNYWNKIKKNIKNLFNRQ